MILYELTGTENHSVYQDLEVSNGNRQYDFLRSVVSASIQINRPFLSTQIIKALNYHVITCLHTNAGEFRPCPVTVGDYTAPHHYRVQALMDDFVNQVNRLWETTDLVVLCAFVLWNLNYIHPFINGNGRTARAACYFVLCLKSGGWLPGKTTLPELIRQNRDEYIVALKAADATHAAGTLDMSVLHQFIQKLLKQQLADQPDPDNETDAEEQAANKP